ncbi:MAG: GNAT family acetyltransferase [Lachnospiraceae bacterium]|nr:GNAT family acetyltransferase [Lachnospiraceae bacterium]
MIEAVGLSLPFLKKEVYTGSHHGMRYLLKSEDDKLKACAYPEPFCFEKTPEEEKVWNEFEFSADGLSEAFVWLTSIHEESYSE